jgi:hypothetical protein
MIFEWLLSVRRTKMLILKIAATVLYLISREHLSVDRQRSAVPNPLGEMRSSPIVVSGLMASR